jgi:thioredoxin-like negative regulator of GroEL
VATAGLYDEVTALVAYLTDNNFDFTVGAAQQPWLVEFYLSWCGGCIEYRETMLEIATNVSAWDRALLVRRARARRANPHAHLSDMAPAAGWRRQLRRRYQQAPLHALQRHRLSDLAVLSQRGRRARDRTVARLACPRQLVGAVGASYTRARPGHP